MIEVTAACIESRQAGVRLRNQDDSVLSNMAFSDCRRRCVSHARFAETKKHDLVGLHLSFYGNRCVVPHLRHGFHSVSLQPCSGTVLDCGHIGSHAVGMLDSVRIRWQATKGMVSYADLPADHCGGGHTTDCADIAGMKIEQNFKHDVVTYHSKRRAA